MVNFYFEYDVEKPHIFIIFFDLYVVFLGLVTTVVILPMILNDDEDGCNLDSVMGTDEIAQKLRMKLFQNRRFQQTIKHFLPKWDSHGLLDRLY